MTNFEYLIDFPSFIWGHYWRWMVHLESWWICILAESQPGKLAGYRFFVLKKHVLPSFFLTIRNITIWLDIPLSMSIDTQQFCELYDRSTPTVATQLPLWIFRRPFYGRVMTERTVFPLRLVIDSLIMVLLGYTWRIVASAIPDCSCFRHDISLNSNKSLWEHKLAKAITYS